MGTWESMKRSTMVAKVMLRDWRFSPTVGSRARDGGDCRGQTQMGCMPSTVLLPSMSLFQQGYSEYWILEWLFKGHTQRGSEVHPTWVPRREKHQTCQSRIGKEEGTKKRPIKMKKKGKIPNKLIKNEQRGKNKGEAQRGGWGKEMKWGKHQESHSWIGKEESRKGRLMKRPWP